MNQTPDEQVSLEVGQTMMNNMGPTPPQTKYVERIVQMYGASLFFKRWGATVIDFVFLVGAASFIFLLQESYIVIGIVAYLLFLLSYYFLLESLTGFTIGKYIFRIRAVNEDGYPPGMAKGFLRTLLRMVDTNPLLLGALPAGICVLATKKKQRLGDMSTNTYVVNTRDLESSNNGVSPLWMVISIVALVSSIALSVGGLVYAVSNEKGVFAPSELEVFQSLDGGFQVTAEDNWSVMNDLHDEGDLSIGNIFAEKYMVLLSSPKVDFDSTYTLEDFRGVYDEYYKGEFPDAQFSEYQLVQVGRYPAYQTEFVGEVDGLDITYILTMIETDDHFHHIIAWTLTSKIDRRREELLEVISTFQPVLN